MDRTQIYLREGQKKELAMIAEEEEKALAEVIREAVDQYVNSKKYSNKNYILESSGLWKNRTDIDAGKYIEKMRKETNARLED